MLTEFFNTACLYHVILRNFDPILQNWYLFFINLVFYLTNNNLKILVVSNFCVIETEYRKISNVKRDQKRFGLRFNLIAGIYNADLALR